MNHRIIPVLLCIGREIGICDEVIIDEVYNRIAKKNHSLRAAVHAIVAHESFARK